VTGILGGCGGKRRGNQKAQKREQRWWERETTGYIKIVLLNQTDPGKDRGKCKQKNPKNCHGGEKTTNQSIKALIGRSPRTSPKRKSAEGSTAQRGEIRWG